MRTLILACLLSPLFGQAPSALPRGERVPRVACLADPDLSYALYLPKGYREDRTWPVLFGFSPGGSGEEPVRLFQQAAERFGWILVGSNDARNGPLRPALLASEAMWEDVRTRFRVDPKRCYAAGFSGGARMALRMALKHPKSFSGLISFGAFGTGEGMLTGLGHLHFYLACGMEDFNHWELLTGREELLARKWSALADRFEGGHQWPPEEVAARALAFLQLGASRDGLAPADPALESEFRQGLAESARRSGETLLGQSRWQEFARIFPDAPEGREPPRAGGTAVAEELRLEQRYGQAARELAEMPKDRPYLEELKRYIGLLQRASAPEKLMLRRLLGGPILQYQEALGEALEKKSWERMLALSTSLAALDERMGWPCIYAAAALVQLGRPQEALPHLKAARDRGYRRPERIRELPELRPLHGREDFEAVLKSMSAPPLRPLP